MSYKSISLSAADPVLMQRITACAAQEGQHENPSFWVGQHIWEIVSSTEIEAAYEYAVDQGNPDPGGDEGVITDAVILAHVQPLIMGTPEAP